MREPDPLHALLEEWKSPEPSPELDRRVAAAYRDACPRLPIWRRFFQARVSVPVPVFAVALLVVLAVFVWLRGSSAPQALPASSDLVTRLNATGFQPLPNGEARVISVKELKK